MKMQKWIAGVEEICTMQKMDTRREEDIMRERAYIGTCSGKDEMDAATDDIITPDLIVIPVRLL